jgi:predicted AAA+ superfamily ATPase
MMFDRWMTLNPERSALVIGPRRSGKTTFLRATFPDFKYATLDDLDLLDWARRDPKGFGAGMGERGIIDEIQREPRLTIAVKYAIDNLGAMMMMTGSSSLGLLDASADTLAGRFDLHSMPTACWGEELGPPTHKIFEDTPSPLLQKEGQRNLEAAMTWGGFPEVITTADPEQKQQVLRNYRDTYFVRDLMQMANLENMAGLQGILANVGRSLGSHLETSSFARESGLSVPTTRKYLNTLYRSELAFELHGYQYGPAKRFVKAAKVYFADNGIITGLGLRIAEGQILENFVISELEKRRKLGFIKSDRFYYYKSQAGREIDLVFESGGVTFAVEIKATRHPSARDATNLKEFIAKSSNPTKGFVFHMGDDISEFDGVRFLPVATLFRGV